MTDKEFPSRARAVVVGGGVIGCSTAYHLAKLGWDDVVLLERKQISSGTTWHAAGLITTLRDTEAQTRLAQYSLQLYSDLEVETGQATGFINCGSIQMAMSEDKAEEMRRGCAMARTFGVENQEISPSDVKALFPLAYVDDLVCGFHFPDDGRVNPADVAQALAKGARQRGVKIIEDTAVTEVLYRGNRAVGVRTDKGDISAEVVVLCPGMWGREVGLMAGVDIPLQAAEHYYLISEPIDGVHNQLPILRDPERGVYAREEAGKIMLGFFEPVAAPWAVDGIPKNFCFDEIQPDWERMEPHIELGMQRLPILFDTGIRQFFCGPESFTPDHNYLMGRAPFKENLFVACGFNSLGILSGGGAGNVMAQWITDGIQPMDIWDVDIRRIQPCHNNKSFVVDRTYESLGIGYQMHWPNRQWQTARNVKQSILHDRLSAAGACFGESAGWERPNWYADPGQSAAYEYDFGRQNWFANNREEHRAVREAVGVFEQSSFAKLLIQGRDAERVLNRIATADVAGSVGKVVYTQFLNLLGGVEADLTITRLADDRFLVVTAAFTQTHVQAWIAENIPDDAFCVITDVTGSYVMLNVQGPNSRALLSAISSTDFATKAFPFGTMQAIEIGYQSAMAVRISYTGELGWELYIPTEMALPAYDQLVAAGLEFGLKHCGYHTLNSLRIEKAYREWAHDMGPKETLLQAGLAFTAAWDKPGGFIGREALLSEREKGPLKSRLVQFLLTDPEPILTHNEPILRDGVSVGYTLSSGYAHTLGGCAALGYVHCEQGVDAVFVDSGRFQIEQANRTYDARASLAPMYDPKSLRTRS
ncbi:MAG: glycine cleavage system aminomethyltransferase T/glycine [Gammaproteobacteria bacterium]|jgi:glycine cleavage system aminomethyltransferase T/glycine/D-amino acid oxidase-like deaminating enzyme